MVVVALLALMLAILLPGLSGAREQARATVCAAQLRQIGLAALAYIETQRGWLVGSPNTSGNGARPGFAAMPYEGDPNHRPAMHVFDWASPLHQQLRMHVPVGTPERFAAAVDDPFRCPSNRRRAGPVQVAPLIHLIPAGSLAPSYATSRFFMYVGRDTHNGPYRGRLWWTHDCVPPGYAPRLERVRFPERKAFLADAHVVSKTQGEISNANWGFASQGAWRSHDEGPVTYRGAFLHSQMWRHRNGINILAFDGHVEYQKEADGRVDDGLGTGARRATWWFPSGTRTEILPSRRSSEPALIVP